MEELTYREFTEQCLNVSDLVEIVEQKNTVEILYDTNVFATVNLKRPYLYTVVGSTSETHHKHLAYLVECFALTPLIRRDETQSFIDRVLDLGYTAVMMDDLIEISEENSRLDVATGEDEFKVLAMINPFVRGEVKLIDFYSGRQANKDALLTLIMEYVKTPVEKRGKLNG